MGSALAGKGRKGQLGRDLPLRNPNLLTWKLPMLSTPAGALPHTRNDRDLVVAAVGAGQTLPLPQPLRGSGGRQDSATFPRPPEAPAGFATSLGVGAAAKRLRMEELSTPWQRSPASPPGAHLADGGNTNYPRASGSCVVRVMLSWSCATPLSTRQCCRGRGVSPSGVTHGDVVAPAWQEDTTANPVFRNQSKG